MDYAEMRFDSGRLARFTSPDPFSGSISAGNPQTWNRYAFVINDPTNLSDPSGLCPRGNVNCILAHNNDDLSFMGYSEGCSIEDIPTPCVFADNLVASGGGVEMACDWGGCGNNISRQNGKYQRVLGVDGWTWVNVLAGEDLSASSVAELGLDNALVADIGDEADRLPPGDTISSSKNVVLRIRNPFLVSCKPGEKQFSTAQISGAETVDKVRVFNVSSGIDLIGRATTLGPPQMAMDHGTYYQFFNTTTGGFMTWGFSGTTAKSPDNPSMNGQAKFRAFARQSIQCQ